MKEQLSLLRQERENRGWSRAKVEALTEGRISPVSLERWEERKSWPRSDNIEELCKLYGKTPEQLGLDKGGGIMVVGNRNVTPNSQEETPMSDLVRRAVFSNLGSKLTSLIDLWPKRNYHYEELQGEINKVVLDSHRLAGPDSISEISRREALKGVGLVPIQLCVGLDGLINLHKAKADTDTLLKHCAAGITACWYLRRSKELGFVSGLISEYIKILQPPLGSKSETHRKASATLLSQTFRLKGSLSRDISGEGEEHYLEAIRCALMSGNPIEQAITQRITGAFYMWNNKYALALPYAEKAYAMKSQDMTRNVRSYIASGLSLCQAANGKTEEAKASLAEALDLFDPTDAIPSMPFSEAILTAVAAAVKQHSGFWQESVALYEKSLTIPDISALGSVQNRINYAKTEVSRDDQDRDMGLCIQRLTEGITGARELDSKRYQHEARECYDLLRIAWPHEDAIKRLGRDHFGIK